MFCSSTRICTISGINVQLKMWRGGALKAKINSLEKLAADIFLPLFTQIFIKDPTLSQYASE